MDTETPAGLSSEERAFLDAPRFAVVATVGPDGAPYQAVVWYLVDGDTLVVNSAGVSPQGGGTPRSGRRSLPPKPPMPWLSHHRYFLRA